MNAYLRSRREARRQTLSSVTSICHLVGWAIRHGIYCCYAIRLNGSAVDVGRFAELLYMSISGNAESNLRMFLAIFDEYRTRYQYLNMCLKA